MKSKLWRKVRDHLTSHNGASARSRRKRWTTQLNLERLEDRRLLTVTDMTQLAQLYPTHSGPTLLLLDFDGGYNDYDKQNITPYYTVVSWILGRVAVSIVASVSGGQEASHFDRAR